MAFKTLLHTAVVALPLFTQSVSAACPFSDLRRSGLLSEEHAAKFEAVRRDPKAAEDILAAHRRSVAAEAQAEAQAQAQAQSNEKRDLIDGLVGPLVNGILDLPFGGGLLNGILQPLSGALANVEIPFIQPQGLKAIPGDDPDHQFEAPGPTDVRGICPTLNALANHGYLSRDGITSFAEAANAVQTAFGFDFPLSVFLSAVGLLAGGDLISGKYSIGGADDRVPNNLGQALGLDKHGVFEIDGSITREDYQFGNNANFILQRWNEYVNTSKVYGGGEFGAATNAIDNGNRYDNSRATNPNFFAGAIWFVVSHAERVFVYEGLSNGTADGHAPADYANVAPWFLNETFPPYWYRRGVPLSLPAAFAEAGDLFLTNPRPLGGNEGLGNFVPLQADPSKLSTSELGCFLLKNILDVAPGQIVGDGGTLDIALGFIKGIIAPFFINDGTFNCNVTSWVVPSANAGVAANGSVSSSGSPVNGAYPGIGIIYPDSQPS